MNEYRNNIRNKYYKYTMIRRVYILTIIALIVGVGYLIIARTNLIQSVKEKTNVTFEEIVNYQFTDIGKVIKKSDKSLEDITEFIAKFSGKKYKLNGYDTMLIKDELEVYYVYNTEDEFIYEIHDLGNDSIRVQTRTGYMKVYDLVK